VEGPGVEFGERVVEVDEADFVLVAIEGHGKELLMHAGAVGALEVVIINDRDLGGGVAANRPVVDRDVPGGNVVEVEGFKARERLVVGGDEEVRGGGVGFMREGDLQGVVAGNVAGLAGAEDYGVFGGDIELAADENLDAPGQGGVLYGTLRGAGGGRSLGFAADSGGEDHGCGEPGELGGGETHGKPPFLRFSLSQDETKLVAESPDQIANLGVEDGLIGGDQCKVLNNRSGGD